MAPTLAPALALALACLSACAAEPEPPPPLANRASLFSPFASCVPDVLSQRLPQPVLARLLQHTCEHDATGEQWWEPKEDQAGTASESGNWENQGETQAQFEEEVRVVSLTDVNVGSEIPVMDAVAVDEQLKKPHSPDSNAASWRDITTYVLEESDELADEQADSAERREGRDSARPGGPMEAPRWDATLGWLAPVQEAVPGALCRNQSRAYVRELSRRTLWALQMLDASGKLPDGVLYGNLNLLGSWDGCAAVRARLNETDYPAVAETAFRGRICAAAITAAPGSDDRSLRMAPLLPAFLSRAGAAAAVRYAYCVPSACGLEDVAVSLGLWLNGSGLQAAVSDCFAEGDAAQMDAADWALVAFLALTAAVVLACTVADVAASFVKITQPATLEVYQAKNVPPGRRTVFVRAFSLYRNGRKLLSTQSGPDTIGCLHGMRFLSMSWVILGHTYVIGLYVTPVTNMGRLLEVLKSWPLQAIINAAPSVDSFLVMSGAMFSYVLMKAVRAGKTVGPREVLMMYVHRYLRLTPLYAMVVWFTATLFRHLGRGPFSEINYSIFGIPGCRTTWYRNLLYINNFYATGEPGTCIDQAWYLALDLQLFLLAPLLVLPVLRWPRAGAAWLAFCGVASTVATGVITYIKDLPPTLLNINVHANDPQTQHDFSVFVYNVPWCRAPPYIIGLGLGLLLARVRSGELSLRLSRGACLLLWLAATATSLLVVYGMYPYNSDPSAAYSRAVAATYGALHRPAWGLAVAWVILACATGHGAPVDALLSHRAWVPLGRLTFAIYLTSMQLQVWYASQARVAVTFEHTLFVYWFLADLVINVAVAAAFSLCFEWPTAALERELLGGPRRAAAAPAVSVNQHWDKASVRVISLARRDSDQKELGC